MPAAGGVQVTDTDVCAGLDVCVTAPEHPATTLPWASGANEPARAVEEPKDAGAPLNGASRKPLNVLAPPADANVAAYVCPAVHVALGRPDATSTSDTDSDAGSGVT